VHANLYLGVSIAVYTHVYTWCVLSGDVCVSSTCVCTTWQARTTHNT